MFQGIYTAVVTPFLVRAEVSEIDWTSFDNLLEWQLGCGIDGLVLYGTTGESPTLSVEEKILLTKRAIEIVGSRVPIIVGAGTNSTQSSLSFIREVSQHKIDGVLAVAPYYNKPSQEGLFQHFSKLALVGKLPVVMYNVPSRTGIEISVDTIERLSSVTNIVAIKQATDSIENFTELCARVSSNISVLSGDDLSTMYAMSIGAKGAISASASVIPEKMLAISKACSNNDYTAARKAQLSALPLIKALFRETNPTPAKYALRVMGKIASDSVRLPLVEVSEDTKKIIENLFT